MYNKMTKIDLPTSNDVVKKMPTNQYLQIELTCRDMQARFECWLIFSKQQVMKVGTENEDQI